jgi:hypothetical protein
MWFFPKKYRHEVFVSHEINVRAAIADELRTRLVEAGLDVWYSGDQLMTGEGLQGAIKEAIEQSRFGVIIFTNTFITRHWPLNELAWLLAKETGNTTVILPVLHKMTIEELAAFSPPIASKFCIHANRGMDYVIKKIVEQINRERGRERKRRQRIVAMTSVVIFLFIFLTAYASYRIINHRPSRDQIQSVVNERINECISTVESKYANSLNTNGFTISQLQIDSVWSAYENYRSYYRNEYEFNNYFTTIRGRGNVEEAIGRDPATMHGQAGYGMDSVDMYWVNKTMPDGARYPGFSLLNKRPTTFTWQGRKEGSLYAIDVTYANGIRYINVSLTLPTILTGTKRHEMSLIGFAPSETFFFEEGSDGNWHLKKVE